MDAESAFRLYRAYRLYFQADSTYNFPKYMGALKMPPLIQQHDRSFFYRISHKLQDPAIHALYINGFFFKPRAYVNELAGPEAFQQALVLASRAENGVELLRHDLYRLGKELATVDLQEWLYGELLPTCIQDVIDRTLPLDVACFLLLIPQPDHGYNWPEYWAGKDDLGLGPAPWIDRLKKVDQLFLIQRPGWRTMTYPLAKDFWTPFQSLAPTLPESASVSLF